MPLAASVALVNWPDRQRWTVLFAGDLIDECRRGAGEDRAASKLVCATVTYTAAEGRQRILDALAQAAEEIALALAELSEAYEHLDERTAERLEEALFGPVQTAYGRAKRTYAEFARRSGLPARDFATAAQVAPSSQPKQLIERALEALVRADLGLSELQDSMLPVEVGDPELRKALAEIRELTERVRPQARELTRTLGR